MAIATVSRSASELAGGQANPAHTTLILAVTGASGSIFAVEMLRALESDERVGRVLLVVSPSALRVLAEETGVSGRNSLVERLLGCEPGGASGKITLLAHEDIGAPIASGSYPVDAMVVLPCSMGTLAGIAHGIAGNLIERAADVCLKERRRLVLCVRETPLNLIHLRNMVAVTEAGATVFPVIPTFYNHPQSVEDIARNYVHRVLQHIGLPQPGAYAWGVSDAAEDLS
jgi:4-hydroxy-3-polyprenylbenzoate decarboxylase